MIKFRKIGQKLREITLFQDNVEQAFKQVNELPFINGRLIDVTIPSNGEYTLQTGLERRPVGFIVVDTAEIVTVERKVLSTEQDNKGLLRLDIAPAGTYKFWVF